jgi:thymidine kinase
MSERIYHPSIGSIELITGPMFSGKTEELIRRVSRSHIARLKTKLFKPDIDTRYSVNHIVSHDKRKLEAINVESPLEILGLSVDADVVGIDEIQFFGEELIDVCTKLANGGKRVIIAGLDKNYRGLPFAPLPNMLCVADYVTKLQAVCVDCGAPATFTFRKDKEKNQEILLGERFDYEALCRPCFHKEK